MKPALAFITLGFISGFLMAPLFYEDFYIPHGQSFFYAYQSLFSGFCALFAGVIAYYGALKNIGWHEQKSENEISKIMEDLKIDSDVVIIMLLMFDELVRQGLPKIAMEILEEVPIELGYKFFDDSSIEKLDSIKRVNVRGMVSNLNKFKHSLSEQNFSDLKKDYEFFLFSYEKVFGEYDAKKSLVKELVKLIKESKAKN